MPPTTNRVQRKKRHPLLFISRKKSSQVCSLQDPRDVIAWLSRCQDNASHNRHHLEPVYAWHLPKGQVAGNPKVIDEARSRKTGRRFYVRQQARELLASH